MDKTMKLISLSTAILAILRDINTYDPSLKTTFFLYFGSHKREFHPIFEEKTLVNSDGVKVITSVKSLREVFYFIDGIDPKDHPFLKKYGIGDGRFSILEPNLLSSTLLS